MITCDPVITCDEVIDGAAKFYNDASEAAPINFNIKKSTYNKMDYYYYYYSHYYYILHTALLVVILLLIIIAICCYCIKQRLKYIPPPCFY